MKSIPSRIAQMLVPIALAATLALAVAWYYPSHLKAGELPSPLDFPKGFITRGCEELKQQRDKLRSDTRLQGVAMTRELAKMNAASAEEYPRLLSLVVNQIAVQQSAMAERQAQLDDDMLEHVMKHIQLGGDSVAPCPLIRRIELAPKSTTERFIPTAK